MPESTEMLTLVDFLRQRLTEDEQTAQRACEHASAEWHLDEEFGETVLWWPPEPHVAENERLHGIPVTADVWRGQTIASGGAQIAPHIARHDPAHVLRDVRTKRWIIDSQCAPYPRAAPPMTETLRILAAAYFDHPDYRREWEPARG